MIPVYIFSGRKQTLVYTNRILPAAHAQFDWQAPLRPNCVFAIARINNMFKFTQFECSSVRVCRDFWVSFSIVGNTSGETVPAIVVLFFICCKICSVAPCHEHKNSSLWIPVGYPMIKNPSTLHKIWYYINIIGKLWGRNIDRVLRTQDPLLISPQMKQSILI